MRGRRKLPTSFEYNGKWYNDKDLIELLIFRENFNYRSIAKIMGISHETVANRVKTFGFSVRINTRPSTINQHKIDDILFPERWTSRENLFREYVDNAKPAYRIASKYGVTSEVILWHLKLNNIPIRVE